MTDVSRIERWGSATLDVVPASVDGLRTDEAAPLNSVPGLVWAFRLHEDGRPEALPVDAPPAFVHDGKLWLHFNLADSRAREWLATLHLPAPARELLLSKDNFQQLHAIDDCIYGVFSDLVREIDESTEQTGFLRFIMSERLLISGRHQALCSVDAMRHMPEDFLRKFNQEMKSEKPDFYGVGEAFWLKSNFVAGYQNRASDSMFDFPLA